MKAFLTALLITVGAAAYYLLVYRPSHWPRRVAYALAPTVELTDSRAEVRKVLRRLRGGERVEVLRATASWVHVRTEDKAVGWVQAKNLVDWETYQAGLRLLAQCQEVPTQAVGHTVNLANLRVESSRTASQITQLERNQRVEIFGRRLIEKPPSSVPPSSSLPEISAAPMPEREAWYLVRADSQAGWVLGRLVELALPPELEIYAQGLNMVAWLVLNTVEDDGRHLPQYLVADRVGTQEYDFTRIRVLTWSRKHHRYATAYVESDLQGYFPIEVTRFDGFPYFRLRLMDKEGRKVQKVYRLFDTITRSLGTVDGWERKALPVRRASSEDRPRPARAPRRGRVS